jgi:hypothetical protein
MEFSSQLWNPDFTAMSVVLWMGFWRLIEKGEIFCAKQTLKIAQGWCRA